MPKLAPVAVVALALLAPVPSLAADAPSYNAVYEKTPDQLTGSNSTLIVHYRVPDALDATMSTCVYPQVPGEPFGITTLIYEVMPSDSPGLLAPGLPPSKGVPVLRPLGSLSGYMNSPTTPGVQVSGTLPDGSRFVVGPDLEREGYDGFFCVLRGGYNITIDSPRVHEEMVVATVLHNADPSRITHRLTVIGSSVPEPAEFLWNYTDGTGWLATLDDFEGPRARVVANEGTSPWEDASLGAAVGGRLPASVEHGIYGTFAAYFSSPGSRGALGVMFPDGTFVPGCGEAFDCQKPRTSVRADHEDIGGVEAGVDAPRAAARPWTADVFLGGSGHYDFVHALSAGSQGRTGLRAVWVDAPMPPGLTLSRPQGEAVP